MKRFITVFIFLWSVISNGQLLYKDGGILVGTDSVVYTYNEEFLNNNGILCYDGAVFNYPVPYQTVQARYSINDTLSNGDLINLIQGGGNAVYISGIGNYAIYDLSGLNDERWNKNAYIGNGFALPEYYDFPWSDWFYHDVSNPYHWKLSDFHYRKYNNQANLLGDNAFGKLNYGDFGYGMKCEASGIIYNESDKAYGEWEFDIYKGLESNITKIFFISSNEVDANSYSIWINNLERIMLHRDGIQLYYTDVGYLENNIFYTIKIIRNSYTDEFVIGTTGTFAVYIKGGSFGTSYVLVDVTGGSGTNPVTDNTYITSNYSVLDIDSGDKISDYYIDGVQENFINWTEGIGTYEIDNLNYTSDVVLYEGAIENDDLSLAKNFIKIIPDFTGDDIPRTWIATTGSPTINGDVIDLYNEIISIRHLDYWVVGKEYKLRATVTNFVGSGNINLPYDGSNVSVGIGDNGVYDYYYTPNTPNIFVYSFQGHTATVETNYIKQIFQNYYKNEHKNR